MYDNVFSETLDNLLTLPAGDTSNYTAIQSDNRAFSQADTGGGTWSSWLQNIGNLYATVRAQKEIAGATRTATGQEGQPATAAAPEIDVTKMALIIGAGLVAAIVIAKVL